MIARIHSIAQCIVKYSRGIAARRSADRCSCLTDTTRQAFALFARLLLPVRRACIASYAHPGVLTRVASAPCCWWRSMQHGRAMLRTIRQRRPQSTCACARATPRTPLAIMGDIGHEHVALPSDVAYSKRRVAVEARTAAAAAQGSMEAGPQQPPIARLGAAHPAATEMGSPMQQPCPSHASPAVASFSQEQPRPGWPALPSTRGAHAAPAAAAAAPAAPQLIMPGLPELPFQGNVGNMVRAPTLAE